MKAGLGSGGSNPHAATVGSSPTQAINPEAGVRVRYFGDYELLEEIARGGMGVVYKARQVSLNRPVALKMILAGKFATEAELKRFRTEAEAAANLQHPNIVAIHEIGEHNGQHYFSMDFVEGKNLADISAGKPMDAQRAAGYVKTIAEAIHFAHQRGTLHRDLKPQNVLIDAADRPRITDFGLAKQTQRESSLTQTGVVMGSPSYMPPEQATGRHDQVGPHSDVYSLGAILYELLTGQPPFLAESAMATMMKVVEQEPDSPRKLNPHVPADLETICLKCLEKRPERRYASARALAEELDRFLKHEPIQARPASALRKAVSWSRRHRALMTAAVSAVILLLVGLAYGLWQQTQYLTWLNTHPGHAKAAGARTIAAMKIGFGGFGFMALLYASLYYKKLSRRLTWDKMSDPSSHFAPHYPIAPRLAAVFCVVGAAGIAGSLFYSAKAIEAFVWEGFIPWAVAIALIYPSFFFGLGLLMQVLREQAAGALGLQPSPDATQLTPEQAGPIHDALFAGRREEAIQLYRQATGASRSEVAKVIMQLTMQLYREQPRKFAVDPLRQDVDTQRLIVLGALVSGAAAIGFPLIPASLWPSWPVAFGGGAAGGVFAVFAMRLKKFWQRLLCFLPMMLSLSLVPEYTKAHNPQMDHLLPWFLGMFAGCMLILCARKKTVPSAAAPAAAGVASAASQAAPVVASAASVGFLGALLGPLLGLMGGYFGAKASIENTRSPRERQFMVRMTWCIVAGVVIFGAAMALILPLQQSHPGRFAVALAASAVIYVAWLVSFILLSNRRQRQIQSEDNVSDYREPMSKDESMGRDVWFADCAKAQVFRVLDVTDPGFEDCKVLYRAKLKTERLTGRACLEMWCRLPGRGEFFSKGLNQIVTGSNDWASFEIPFFLKKGERPDLIRLNLLVASTGWLWKKAVSGKVWIKGVELLKAPLQ
jgi:tRNA A-37 threonylcarbamoyl transferase component Bud32